MRSDLRASRVALAVCAAACLVAAPIAAAQETGLHNPTVSTPTDLYFHIFDTFNRFVINTQPMNVEFFDVGGTNFPTIPETPVLAEAGWDFNTIYGTSTAGPVEYDFLEDGKPRFHHEPGIADDVVLDRNYETRLMVYFEVPNLLGVEAGVGLMPYLTVRTAMRTGDAVGAAAEDLDAGTLIMGGETTVHVWSGYGPFEGTDDMVNGTDFDGIPVVVPDGDGIVGLEIPLTIEAAGVIPKREAFNVRLDWYQWTSSPLAAGEDTYHLGNFKVISDEDHLPRIEMAVMNPVYFEFLHPQVAAGTLLIHAGANSPWGTYDLDIDNATIEVTGPSAPKDLKRVIAQNIHVHNLHDQAAEITYLWKFRDEGAKSGDYTIRMCIKNYHQTAEACATAGFKIEGQKAFGIADTGEIVPPTLDDEAGAPAAGLAAALALLGAVAVARRR